MTLDRIEYNATTKKLIISCASAEHNFMAGIGREIMSIVSANSNSFTANDPSYEIIENGDSGNHLPSTPTPSRTLTNSYCQVSLWGMKNTVASQTAACAFSTRPSRHS